MKKISFTYTIKPNDNPNLPAETESKWEITDCDKTPVFDIQVESRVENVVYAKSFIGYGGKDTPINGVIELGDALGMLGADTVNEMRKRVRDEIVRLTQGLRDGASGLIHVCLKPIIPKYYLLKFEVNLYKTLLNKDDYRIAHEFEIYVCGRKVMTEYTYRDQYTFLRSGGRTEFYISFSKGEICHDYSSHTFPNGTHLKTETGVHMLMGELQYKVYEEVDDKDKDAYIINEILGQDKYEEMKEKCIQSYQEIVDNIKPS